MNQLLARRVFEPLGMTDTGFLPRADERNRIAPTESESDWRNGYRRSDLPRLMHICGEVHDPIAFVLGGISGNAGLFSTAADLAKFCQLALSGGASGTDQIFRAETITEWSRRHSVVDTRALGWDTKSVTGSSAGSKFSSASFGHTGYTGTSIWIDPEREVYAILLTNRVHPNDSSLEAMKFFRPSFHDAVIEALD